MNAVEVADDGPVRVITLNRPERRNATSAELMGDLNDALPMPSDDTIRAVVLTGKGESFSAGGDLKAARLALEPGSRRMREIFSPVVARIAALPLPVIAAVNGPAVGAGFSLSLAADVRVASTRAVFVAGFVDVGLATDTGASFFLPRLVGHGRAFEILATGRKVRPAEALAMGLVTRVVEPETLMTRALELAQLLSAKPGIAVPAVKELLEAAAHDTLAGQLEREARMYDRASTHPARLAARAAMVAKLTRGRPATPDAEPVPESAG